MSGNNRSLGKAAALLVTMFALAIAPGCSDEPTDTTVNPGGGGGGGGTPQPSLVKSLVTVSSPSLAPSEASTLTLVTKDDAGAQLPSGGLNVSFTQSGGTSQGTIGTVADNQDGTYAATFLAVTEGTPTTIGAMIEGSAVTSLLPTIQVQAQPTLTDTAGTIPLIDMAGYRYRPAGSSQGYPGLLYPESNSCPAEHVARQPSIDTSGPVVMMSSGFSNVKQEFCDPQTGNVGPQNCAGYSFVGRATSEPTRADNLVIVNAAQSSQEAIFWDEPSDNTYNVARSALAVHGKTESDVQVVWCKHANVRPTRSLANHNPPSQEADAVYLLRLLGDVVRAHKFVYPNLQQMYFSCRIWSCGNGGANDEPFAYENGFAVKWLIEAQINQLETGQIDPIAGDLALNVAPWLAWGPYLWANDGNGRSDGLTWVPSEFMPDCTHPADVAKGKVGDMIWDFFSTSPLTTPWFLD